MKGGLGEHEEGVRPCMRRRWEVCAAERAAGNPGRLN